MNKKLLKTPLFVAACFTLVGCSTSTIVARPAWADTKIFENIGDKDNKMKNIYDAVKALGDTNANVLTRILYEISKTNIGKFDKVDNTDTDLTLTAIVDKASKDSNYYKGDEFKKFVTDHPYYKSPDKGGKLEGTNSVEHTFTDDEKLQVSLNKVKAKYESILSDIYEKIYEEIKGGTYSDSITKIFNEKFYVDYLKKELYNVGSETSYKEDAGIFMPKLKSESWKDHLKNYVTLDKGRYNDYVNRKILPELYKTYLIQTYVKDQRFSSLGRSYARKVNMVAVPYTDHYAYNIKDMLRYYAKNYITEKTSTFDDFEVINKAIIGFVGTYAHHEDTSNEFVLLNNTVTKSQSSGEDVNFESLTDETASKNRIVYVPYSAEGKKALNPNYKPEEPATIRPTTVYKGTKLGDLVEKLMKCCDVNNDGTNPTTFTLKTTLKDAALTAYNDITSNGKYPLALGMELKEREILQNDITKDGWFLKNGGLTDLDSKFRDNLFNIATSNQVDSKEKKSDFKPTDYIRYFDINDKTSGNVKRAFLTTETTETESAYNTIVLHNATGSNKFMYIIEVEEAVSSSKFSEASNENSYYRLKAETTNPLDSAKLTDEVISEVVKANATGDTYKNNANQYYLMISNIIFYDQSVYDYFKSQFPDLFK